MKRRYIRAEAATRYCLCLEGHAVEQCISSCLIQTEELALHTNDPQRSVSVLIFRKVYMVIAKYGLSGDA